MSKCKITIITVCFNSAITIEKAIQSVISQSYKNIEYIIIDGGSTDGTVEIIKKYNAYISYWISEPDRGIYHAMNKGCRMATGDLIGFLSSNDWYEKDALLAIADKYKETHADLIYGDAIVVDGEKSIYKDYSKAKLEDSYYYMPIIHPAFFVKTKIQKKYGFDETYRIAADYKFFMQIYHDGYQFAYTKHNIIYFCLGGVSSERERTSIEARRASYEVVGEQYKDYEEGIERLFFENLYSCLDIFIKNGFWRKWIRENIDVDEYIYIFGAGDMGGKTYRYLKDAELNIIGFIDNNRDKQGGKYKELPVFAPEKILHFGHGIIVISSYDYADEMEKQLLYMKLGSHYKIVRGINTFFEKMVNDYIAKIKIEIN